MVSLSALSFSYSSKLDVDDWMEEETEIPLTIYYHLTANNYNNHDVKPTSKY